MSEPYIGMLSPIAFGFAPRGTMMCDGTLLNITQYPALYSLINNVFGGDGVTTFALPDLRCRAVVGAVSLESTIKHGLTPRPLGSALGEETVTLSLDQVPSHSHEAYAIPVADQTFPQNNYWGGDPNGLFPVYGTLGGPNGMDPAPLGDAAIKSTGGDSTGGTAPHANMPPFTVINYVIAVAGLYPMRN